MVYPEAFGQLLAFSLREKLHLAPCHFAQLLLEIAQEQIIVAAGEQPQNIIVIRTLPGLASAAGSAIDAMNFSTVVGALAGDDTVMVVMRDNNAAAAFCGEIKNLLK